MLVLSACSSVGHPLQPYLPRVLPVAGLGGPGGGCLHMEEDLAYFHGVPRY